MSEELMAMIESLVREHYGTQGLEYLRNRIATPPAAAAAAVPTEQAIKDALRCTGWLTHDQSWECAGVVRAMLSSAPATTEAVAQGGGVDVEKVMALIEGFGQEKWNQGDNQYRRGCESSATYYSEEAGRIRDRIRALLASAPAVPFRPGVTGPMRQAMIREDGSVWERVAEFEWRPYAPASPAATGLEN